MKKLLAILTFICLLLLICGHAFLFTIKRAEIKADVRKELLAYPNENLLTLHFTPDEIKNLSWENDNEFEYEGKMYDVVKKEMNKAFITILCMADEKETILIDNYLKAQQHSSQHSSSTTLLKLLSQQYVMSFSSEILPPVLIAKKNFPSYLTSLHFAETTIVVPPPKAG
jgi:hypothetical protein